MWSECEHAIAIVEKKLQDYVKWAKVFSLARLEGKSEILAWNDHGPYKISPQSPLAKACVVLTPQGPAADGLDPKTADEPAGPIRLASAFWNEEGAQSGRTSARTQRKCLTC